VKNVTPISLFFYVVVNIFDLLEHYWPVVLARLKFVSLV